MVSLINLIIGTAAMTAAGTNAFKKLCKYPYEQCGWVLANSVHDYSFAELQAASGSEDGSHIYDALYTCDPETGVLRYITWCGGAGRCSSGVVPNDNCIDL